jgi:hypothetical protein
MEIEDATLINEDTTMQIRSLSIELTEKEWQWLEQFPNHRHWELSDRVAYLIRCKIQESPPQSNYDHPCRS